MAPAMPQSGRRATADPRAPRRMAFFYVPQRRPHAGLDPGERVSSFGSPRPSRPWRRSDDLLVLTGLAQDKAVALGDGPGDHARSLACFLTGRSGAQDRRSQHPRRPVGRPGCRPVHRQANAAPLLELGIDRARRRAIATRAIAVPIRPTFPGGRPPRRWPRRSIRVSSSNACLHPTPAGLAGRPAKRDRYARASSTSSTKTPCSFAAAWARTTAQARRVPHSVREIGSAAGPGDKATDLPQPGRAAARVPKDTPRAHPADARPDGARLPGPTSTRISTFMFANEGSIPPMPSSRARRPPRPFAPRRRPQEAREDQRHQPLPHRTVRLFAQQAESIREGEGNLLDHSMIVYGSGISDGDRHNHDDLPVLLAGRETARSKPAGISYTNPRH